MLSYCAQSRICLVHVRAISSGCLSARFRSQFACGKNSVILLRRKYPRTWERAPVTLGRAGEPCSRHRGLAASACATSTMKTNRLGTSDQEWTEVCLGTMTWGVQNTEQEAHEQLDYAIKERKVNCIDTAELYPVPSSDPRWKPGKTEEYIGSWLAKNPGIRETIYIATKVTGFNPNSDVPRHRSDPPKEQKANCRLDRESIHAACDASLRRMQTTYIDLYQLHWPDRYVPIFGSRTYNPARERPGTVPMEETATALKELLDAGKIKAWGLSNETAYGVARWLEVAKALSMPPPASIQNPFCMLDRSFEGALAEACAPSNGNIGLLPWSVLGGGALSGKYRPGARPEDIASARHVLYPGFMSRFLSDRCRRAIEKYAVVAKEADMSLATLALAFCKTRWFIPSTIIGATSMKQLKENIDAFSVELSEDVLVKIDKVHGDCLDPVLGA